eukprot:Colp12_sorted_trinity150504_noHs@20241
MKLNARNITFFLLLVALPSSLSYGPMKTETFLSRPLPLRPGDVINTDSYETELQFPKGRYGITELYADIVGSDGETAIPLSQVYNHHTIFYNKNFTNAGPCPRLPFTFAIAVETRHNWMRLPAPYAYVVEEDERWFANIHIIDTRHVDDVQTCIECHCPGSNPSTGGLKCCPDGFRCQISNSTKAHLADWSWEQNVYYLRYRITYVPVDQSIIPVKSFIYSASDCLPEYDFPACRPEAGETCMHEVSETFEWPFAQDIVYMAGHQHNGAFNISVYKGEGRENVFTAHAGYGSTPNKAGDELGYLVSTGDQMFPTPLHVSAHEKLQIVGRYNNTIGRDGLMSYIIAFAHVYE